MVLAQSRKIQKLWLASCGSLAVWNTETKLVVKLSAYLVAFARCGNLLPVRRHRLMHWAIQQFTSQGPDQKPSRGRGRLSTCMKRIQSGSSAQNALATFVLLLHAVVASEMGRFIDTR